MSTETQITQHLESLEEAKQAEMHTLHEQILKTLPGCRLWFDNGIDEKGKVVTNPTIGYGHQLITYANGTTKDFFRIGLSANTTGISVYILGIKDKTYLAETYGKQLGKAKVTGYCIKFKSLKDINADVLMEAVTFGSSL